MNYREKYGKWAFVAGGSVGMGGAYCDYLAKEGMNIVVTGRNMDRIETKCRQLEEDYNVETKAFSVDFGDLDILEKVKDATSGLEIGFLVYNAGLANMAAFTERNIEEEMYRLNLNVRSPLALSLWFVKGMAERKKGGIILMGSLGGVVGNPYVQTYSATKAYNFTLAEAVWGELVGTGIDIMSVLPGNTIGQNFSDVPAGTPGFQTGAEVVEEAFSHLGKDPAIITGEFNRDSVGSLFDVDARKRYILARKKEMEDIRAQFGTGLDN